MRLDGAAMHLDEPFDQGQTNAESALRLLVTSIGLVKHVEQVGKMIGSDTDAVVGDPQDYVIGLAVGTKADAAALGRVFGGVVQKIHQCL